MTERRKAGLQLILIGIIIIVAILYMVFIKPFYYNFNGGEIHFEPTYIESFSDNMTYDIHALDGNIYVCSINGFKKIAGDGEHLWDQSFYAKNATMYYSGKYMCVVDINGTDAYLFDEEGLISEVSTDYPIIMADINQDGAMSFMMQTGDTYRLDIYNRIGNKAVTRDIVVDEDGYPVSLDVSDDGQTVAISHIQVDEKGSRTNLTLFAFNDTTTQNPNHEIGGFLLDDIWMAKVVFLDNETLMGITKDGAYFYDCGDGVNQIATYEFEKNIKDYDLTDEAVIMVFYDGITMSDEIVVLDYEGELMSTEVIEGELENIVTDDTYYYVIKPYVIEKYEGDDRVWFTETSRTVTNILELGKEQYLIEYGSSFEIIQMKEI